MHAMLYLVRPAANTHGTGGVGLIAGNAREALDCVRDLSEQGLANVRVFDGDGKEIEIAALEGEVRESDRAERS